MNPRHLCLWSGPRNVSTALMYSFARRSDTTVVDEPLYAHYLRVSGAPHPGREEVLRGQNPVGEAVMAELLGRPWDTPVVFHKQMAHHLVDIDDGFLTRTENLFLVRPPAEMLPSLAKVIGTVTLRDTGLPAQADLLRRLRERGQRPLVVDGTALRRQPERVLRRLCERLGLPFDPAMLTWPAGPRPFDGVWARHWYAAVHASTGFRPVEKTPSKPLPEDLAGLLEDCEELYARLTEWEVCRDLD